MHAIVVHGGAWDIPDDMVKAHLKGVRSALEIGLDMLRSNGSAEEAVEAAIAYMEDDETFDAGRGSFLNCEGEVTHQAIMYHGTKRRFGSVIESRRVKNPIKAARRLMYEDEMSILAGEGVERYAEECDLDIVESDYFIVERERERLREWKEKGLGPASAFGGSTVGAVALDKDGCIVAGTSTGGTPNRYIGRVADTPIPGCGAYADPTAGASATGFGEAIMRVNLTYIACEYVRGGMDVWPAAERAIKDMDAVTGGHGGVIILTNGGECAWAYNTPRMARAWVSGGKIRADV